MNTWPITTLQYVHLAKLRFIHLVVALTFNNRLVNFYTIIQHICFHYCQICRKGRYVKLGTAWQCETAALQTLAT